MIIDQSSASTIYLLYIWVLYLFYFATPILPFPIKSKLDQAIYLSDCSRLIHLPPFECLLIQTWNS